MSFWKQLLAGALNQAAKTSSDAINGGADLKTTGVAAGAGALVGLLTVLLSHPLGQHPAVQAAVAPKIAIEVPIKQ